jgi:hypothetical protein
VTTVAKGRALRRRYGRAKAGAPKKGFQKVWFSKGAERTAGLILPAEKLYGMSISEVSRLFPVKEGLKMARFHTSPVFDTWDEAFAFGKD